MSTAPCLPIGGWLVSATTYYYNADGEVTATFDYSRDVSNADYWNVLGRQRDDGTLDTVAQQTVPATVPSLANASAGYGDNGSGQALLTLRSQVTHWDPDASRGISGYDAEGHAQIYAYSAFNITTQQWHTTTYQVSYLKQDGYLEEKTAGTSDDATVVATTDTSYYDAFGRRVAIDTHSANTAIPDQVRAFAYDAEGQILERRDGSVGNNGAGTFSVTANGGYATQHYAYVQGQQIGSVDEAGTIDVLSGVTGFSNSDAGSNDYVAQAGDTMQSIAQTVYGDASLWYVVADANGFESATDAPAAGQSLKLPEVQTNSNTAETFKPYNPHEISGSTTPTLPMAPQPPPSAQGCQAGLAVIVVAVVVAIVAPEIAPVLAAALGGGTAAAVVGGVMAGVAADAAGQITADALGLRNGFSWKEAEVTGLSYGISYGVGSKLSAAGKAAAADGGTALANGAGHLTTAGEAVMGGVQYLGDYAADKVVGEPAQFSWAGLVAHGVGAATASAAGLPTAYDVQHGFGGNLGDAFAGGLLDGAVTREASLALGDDRVESWQQIGEDAFGNALGNAAAGAINEANAVSEARQAHSTASLLAADDPNSQVNPVAAFLSGPYANDFDDEDGLAGYDPFNRPLLASADGYSTQTGVYGLPSPSLTPSQATDVRSMQSATPWLPAGEWSSDTWQTWLGAGGDVWAYTNPVYDANGVPVMENGLQVSEAPVTTVTPTAEELAQARGGPQMVTTSSPEGATDMIRSQLGLPKDAIISANSIMNVAQVPGPYTEAENSGPELSTQALEDRARHEFGGILVFSVEVRSQVLTTFAMVNGTHAANANADMMNGMNTDAQGYAYDHAPTDRNIPENEQSKVVVDSVGSMENIGTEVSEVPASRLEYRYDVFVSPFDPSNFRVEVTQYHFDYTHGGGMLHYHPFLPQAYVLLNGSDK
jgi:LysM repeat protein